MGILKHTPLAQSVGKGDVDVITPSEVSASDLGSGIVVVFFTQPKSRNMILAILTTTYRRN